jgi:hypothetical protein
VPIEEEEEQQQQQQNTWAVFSSEKCQLFVTYVRNFNQSVERPELKINSML